MKMKQTSVESMSSLKKKLEEAVMPTTTIGAWLATEQGKEMISMDHDIDLLDTLDTDNDLDIAIQGNPTSFCDYDWSWGYVHVAFMLANPINGKNFVSFIDCIGMEDECDHIDRGVTYHATIEEAKMLAKKNLDGIEAELSRREKEEDEEEED